jgi:hypothetical protein
MSIYFSERAARLALGYAEVVSVPSGLERGTFKLNVNSLTAPRTRTEELLKAAAVSGRQWTAPHEAKANDVVDVELEGVDYGAVKTAMVGGRMKPFWTFLMHGHVKVVGVAPAVSVMGVGSVGNYSNFSGNEGPLRGTWYASSPEGRSEVYQKLGILGIADRDREFSMFDGDLATETAPGHQVDLFEDLFMALNHNQANNTWEVDDKRLSANRVRLIAQVEDTRASANSGAALLVRPILMEFLG